MRASLLSIPQRLVSNPQFEVHLRMLRIQLSCTFEHLNRARKIGAIEFRCFFHERFELFDFG